MDNKLQELQDKLVAAAKKGMQEELDAVKAELEDLKSKNSRFTVKQDDVKINSLSAAISKLASDPGLPQLAKTKQGIIRVEVGGHPADLAKKAITYNPGNQTISGDIRRVLASEDRPGVTLLPRRPPAIRDLLTVVPTTAQFINWVAETSTTNDAAWVADGGLKPESDLALVVKRQPVETIAHYMRVPIQILEDVNSFQDYLESRLVDMLREKSEDSYLYGSGTSPEILGITQFPDIQTITQDSSDNRIDTIRKALNKLETSYYPWADAIVCHPNDVMRMELLKDNQDRYLWPLFGRWSDAAYASKTLFGVPVIATTAITEGTFLVGNFSKGATLYQRQDVTVDVFFQDRDNVIYNLATIRCESRECLVPEHGPAFVLGNFLGASYD